MWQECEYMEREGDLERAAVFLDGCYLDWTRGSVMLTRL
jgi:hypothetical protein